MDILKWIIGIVAVYLAIQYVVGPVLVYLNQRIPTRYKFELLDPQAFLSGRSEAFQSLHREILQSGFRYVGSAEMLQSHSALYLSIYYSAERRLACTLVNAKAADNPVTTQFEFTQMYEDGTLLSVNNNSLIGVYPRWEIKEAVRFAGVSDFVELLALAEKAIAIKKGPRVAASMDEGEEFAIIEKHLNEETQHLIDLGWVSARPVGDAYRLTPRGAILMTWKLCWPVKAILGAIDSYRSRRLLQRV